MSTSTSSPPVAWMSRPGPSTDPATTAVSLTPRAVIRKKPGDSMRPAVGTPESRQLCRLQPAQFPRTAQYPTAGREENSAALFSGYADCSARTGGVCFQQVQNTVPQNFVQTPQPALVAFLAVEFRPFALRYDPSGKAAIVVLSFSFYLWSGPSPVRSGQSGRQTAEVVSGCGRLIAGNATPPLVAPAALEATQPVSLRPAREFSRGLASC